MDDQDTPIIDADVVEPTDSEEVPQTQAQSADDVPSDVSVLLNIESLIKSHITGLDQRRSELKRLKEMMASAFKNDPTYQDAETAVKEATKMKKEAKFVLLKLPEVKNVDEKVKELSTEVKDMDGALSDYLREYQRLSGSNEITDDNGQVHEITYVAKLVRKGIK